MNFEVKEARLAQQGKAFLLISNVHFAHWSKGLLSAGAGRSPFMGSVSQPTPPSERLLWNHAHKRQDGN
eukprot:2293660-Amphidinium_carterae.1